MINRSLIEDGIRKIVNILNVDLVQLDLSDIYQFV